MQIGECFDTIRMDNIFVLQIGLIMRFIGLKLLNEWMNKLENYLYSNGNSGLYLEKQIMIYHKHFLAACSYSDIQIMCFRVQL